MEAAAPHSEGAFIAGDEIVDVMEVPPPPSAAPAPPSTTPLPSLPGPMVARALSLTRSPTPPIAFAPPPTTEARPPSLAQVGPFTPREASPKMVEAY